MRKIQTKGAELKNLDGKTTKITVRPACRVTATEDQISEFKDVQ